jgi:hypothetical protein
VRRLISARVGGFWQQNREVLVHKKTRRFQTLRLGINSVASGLELRQAGLRGRPRRG